MDDDAVFGFRVTQASLNQTAFDYARNFRNAIDAIDEAARNNADLLAFEELMVTAYDGGDNFEETDNDKILSFLYDVAAYAQKARPGLILSIGHPYRYADKNVEGPKSAPHERRKSVLYNRLNRPFNVQSFIAGGKILGMTAKNYLFDYERGYESRYFSQWSIAEANDADGYEGTILIDVPGPDGTMHKVPFGRPIVHLTDGKRRLNLFHTICEEKWVATRYDGHPDSDADYERDNLIAHMPRRFGREGLVNVIANASPPSKLKIDKHVHLAGLASRYADLVVDTDGVGTSGATFAQFGYRIAAQNGDVFSYGPRLGFGRVLATSWTARVKSADADSEFEADATCIHNFSNAGAAPQAQLSYKGNDKAAQWDDPAYMFRGEEETLRMSCLWLFDYMRKNKTRGIVEALSGGADSAFNTTLVMLSMRLAVNELGMDGFAKEMAHLPYIDAMRRAHTERGVDAAMDVCMQNMLTAVYMGTDNSSDATRNAASFLIKGGTLPDGTSVRGIGGKFDERNVQGVLDFYPAVQVVSNIGGMAPERRLELQHEVAKFLNTRPGSVPEATLGAWEKDIRTRFPEIEDELVSAARPKHGIAYENIQARARQVLIFLYANKEGKMPVANPNLDEGRNSYATFGGDLHSGTINLNAHLNKDYQLRLMRYLCEFGLMGVCPPVTALAPTLANKPTAELQPKNEEGKVVQNDEDALQRSFRQMDRISHYMLEARTGAWGERRLNAGEIFDACKKDTLFEGLEDFTLYNQVAFSFKRWWLAQHKIHASPIAMTYGSNVDHQVSKRTPNISGQNLDDVATLGLKLVFAHEAEKGRVVPPEQQDALLFRVQRDERAITAFFDAVRGDETMDTRLARLTGETMSWDRIFRPLPANDPIMRAYAAHRQRQVPS